MTRGETIKVKRKTVKRKCPAAQDGRGGRACIVGRSDAPVRPAHLRRAHGIEGILRSLKGKAPLAAAPGRRNGGHASASPASI